MMKLLIVALSAFLIYVAFLDRSPIYLHHDEVLFALNAQSIASTGRDVNGRLLPLYFQISRPVNMWFHPVLVYFTALWLTVLPLSESSIRLPTVIVGMIDVVLMYFVAYQIFKRTSLALVASALLALTPAHFILSRLAANYVYPLPFVLGWLLCLLKFEERQRGWLLFVGAMLLGVGLYSYLASIIMMPVFLALTAVILFRFSQSRRRLTFCLIAVGGFVVPLLMLVPWLFENPMAYAQTAQRYELYDSSRLGFVRGFGELLRPTSVVHRFGVYVDFFSPSFLFLRGDASALHSTGRAGVFLLPVAIFLVLGFYQLMVHPPKGSTNVLLWAGLFTAPLAGALVAEPHRISRASPMLPFVVLVATFGVEYAMSSSRRLQRAAGICLLALVPIQFGYFYFDYLTAYRVRSGFWFERNIRGGMEEIIGRESPGSPYGVYLSTTIPFVDYYWRFYLTKYHRQELLSRTVYFDARAQGLEVVPAHTLILTDVSDLEPGRPYHSDDLHPVRVLVEPDHTPSFSIYER